MAEKAFRRQIWRWASCAAGSLPLPAACNIAVLKLRLGNNPEVTFTIRAPLLSVAMVF